MLSRKIAGRYAEALFDLAQERGTTAAWAGELSSLAQLMATTPDLVAVLTHPEVPVARKRAVLTTALTGQVAGEILAVLLLLVRRGHEPDMATVADIFQERWNRARKVLPVTITAAAPLTDSQRASLTAVLHRRTGATVELRELVDPTVLAGLVIRMGDRVIDASARGTLESLRIAFSV
jgi:F-type H+-transporting ATPase subunit delta